tara:strand:+ start:4159 stop:5049 length:891 start_codon:yes stop_codon:yes gene_type:complete
MGLISTTQTAYYGGSSFGGYQFTSLETIINQFIVAYVGEEKIIPKIKRTDVAFHARRALQEFSFDTFKSTKSLEIELPASLTMTLPQDYVNYVKLVSVDAKGIEHVLYPAKYSSNPTAPLQTGSIGNESFIDGNADGNIDLQTESNTWENFQASTPNSNTSQDFDYDDDIYDLNIGGRYGIDPAHAQVNGSFYIDEIAGKIHFSSNLGNKIITLKYISDSLGTDAEMKVHKLAEEAMYKQIALAILSVRANVPEYIINRFKKEARATKRNAKLRLSNIKIEEITQIFRGKSKHIKH